MRSEYDEESLLALSGIRHMAVCERQWALVHVEQQWMDNVSTVEGRQLHERAHDPWLREEDSDRIVVRSMPIASYELGLFGRADVVEFWAAAPSDPCAAELPGHDGVWIPRPVEYKRGRPKSDDCDIVQLCAQAMCLEEMLGAKVIKGDMFYWETRRRHSFELNEELRARVAYLARRMHEFMDAGLTPPPSSRKRCSACSLLNICFPSLASRSGSVFDYIRGQIGDFPQPGGDTTEEAP